MRSPDPDSAARGVAVATVVAARHAMPVGAVAAMECRISMPVTVVIAVHTAVVAVSAVMRVPTVMRVSTVSGVDMMAPISSTRRTGGSESQDSDNC